MSRSWIVGLAVAGVAAGCAEMDEDEPALSSPVATLGEGGEGSRTSGLDVSDDGLGTTASFSSNDFNAGPSQAFFSALGTNKRTCNSCHQKDQGWSISAGHVKGLAPDDPIFAPVDGSDCPPQSADQGPDSGSSKLLLAHGVIRIQLAIPDDADFDLADATNPQHCSVPPGSPAAGGALYLFRRPLPTANLEFLSSIMWDGRETLQPLTQRAHLAGNAPLRADLAHQADSAALIHEQRTDSIRGTTTALDLLGFETPLYVAQLTQGALRLDSKGAHGGPRYLGEVVSPAFFVGENDPADRAHFDREVFRIYKAWEPGPDGHARPHLTDAQRAIGRGERLFNTRTFRISGVAGLNSTNDDPLANSADPLFDQPITGTCSTCHNAFDVGDHSTPLFLNIGVTMAGALRSSDLPAYTLRSASGATVKVNDPGRALVTGRFVDAGKTKVPSLRGLPARAPYFHDGAAPDLASVVHFYDGRFGIGLTEAEVSDLVAFLGAL
jgi:hypothetical protein